MVWVPRRGWARPTREPISADWTAHPPGLLWWAMCHPHAVEPRGGRARWYRCLDMHAHAEKVETRRARLETHDLAGAVPLIMDQQAVLAHDAQHKRADRRSAFLRR